MIQINIEIKKRNKFKELFYKIYNKAEDTMCSIIQKLPEKFIPHFLMEWLQQYMYKRIAELNQQIVQDKWKSMELHKVADTIRQQDINKAPSGD